MIYCVHFIVELTVLMNLFLLLSAVSKWEVAPRLKLSKVY